MEQLMVASTVIDVVAVGALAWLVLRTGRARKDAFTEQRATLEALRGDIAQLVADAEQRAIALDNRLGARERRLRALLDESARIEGGDAPGGDLRIDRGAEWAAEIGVDRPRPAAPVRAPAAGAAAARTDPAEARLLRDLDVRLAARRA
jgi:hypothetical protein